MLLPLDEVLVRRGRSSASDDEEEEERGEGEGEGDCERRDWRHEAHSCLERCADMVYVGDMAGEVLCWFSWLRGLVTSGRRDAAREKLSPWRGVAAEESCSWLCTVGCVRRSCYVANEDEARNKGEGGGVVLY